MSERATGRGLRSYYNDNDPAVAQWLRNLIVAGLLPKGDVDERSIKEVTKSDVSSYTQCHFFAGIGGWPYALSLVGWPATRHVWTGSCPCQPYSAAGQGKGDDDPRNLWPAFRRLIAECQPAIVFGEQVASKDGRLWLSGVRTDLEALDYAVGCADLCAAGVGAPHVRPRLWWVADATSSRLARPESQWGRVRGLPREAFAERRDGSLPARLYDVSTPASVPAIDGIPRPVDILRGYGGSLVPQVAAEFVSAYLEVLTRVEPTVDERE